MFSSVSVERTYPTDVVAREQELVVKTNDEKDTTSVVYLWKYFVKKWKTLSSLTLVVIYSEKKSYV